MDMELIHNDEMVCPYCKTEQSDSWEYLMNDNEDGTAECGECGKEFKWHADHSTTYDTAILDK